MFEEIITRLLQGQFITIKPLSFTKRQLAENLLMTTIPLHCISLC